jgi:hypothetical protein
MLATHCANESALRIHLRTVDQEERRLTAIENRAASLMLGELSPNRTAVVLSALQDINEAVCDAIAIHLGHISHKHCAIDRQMHYSQIGRLIAGAADNWAAREATRRAENEIGG